MFTFKSVGHFFAKVYKDVVVGLHDIEKTATVVETVTASVWPQAVPVEKAAYAVLGEISSLLTTGGEAASQHLTNAGMDIAVINQVKDVLASVPHVVAIASKL